MRHSGQANGVSPFLPAGQPGGHAAIVELEELLEHEHREQLRLGIGVTALGAGILPEGRPASKAASANAMGSFVVRGMLASSANHNRIRE